MSDTDDPILPDFFACDGGATGIELAATDWSGHILGSPDHWPVQLRSMLATILASPEAMFLAWGPDLVFFFNDAYRPLLGARATGAIGRRFADLWSDEWPDLQPIVERALGGEGVRFEEWPLTVTRNGYPEATWWSFSYMPLLDGNGGTAGMWCVTNEMTAQVTARQAADAERKRQELSLQRMPGFAAILTGPDHRYDYVNDAYRGVGGNRDYIDRTVREVFPELEGQGFYELLDETYATGVPFQARSLPIDLDGEARARFIDLLYHPIRDDRGDVSGIFVGGYDTTDQVRAEAELKALNDALEERVEERTAALRETQDALRQSQKLEAVGQLTGGVAHDFNNLLTIIRSAVDFLKRDDLKAEKRQRYLDAVSETVDRATKLTGQLLAFARRSPLKPEVFDLNTKVEGVIELIRPVVGARVELSFEECHDNCFANADVSQFETALVNLAVNARDAMDGEGKLHFAVRHAAEVPSIRGHARAEGAFVAISITDTGGGIPEAALGQIFEPFFTTKQVGKGTGLGLSQVFGFAKQSGGEVEVTSVEGSGTTFTIYLPRVGTPPAPDGREQDEVEMVAPAGRYVLVVEDNEAVGHFATAMLEDLGYSTHWVGNAAEALRELDAARSPVDAVFTDVIMPGMNGVELAKTIRERHPQVPVILTSGYSNVLAEEGRHGFELLQKPYSVQDLSKLLHRTLGYRSGRTKTSPA